MKALVLSTILAVVAVAHATDTARMPERRPRLTQALRQRAEAGGGARDDSARGSDDVVTLATLEVNQRYRAKPKAEVPTEHSFTWREGGTFVRRDGRHFTTILKFQTNPNDDGMPVLMANDPGFNILSILW